MPIDKLLADAKSNGNRKSVSITLPVSLLEKVQASKEVIGRTASFVIEVALDEYFGELTPKEIKDKANHKK